MPTEKWGAGTDRGTVLTTQLNALADSGTTAIGSEIDNTANLDRFGQAELLVDFVSAPTAESICDLYCVAAPDGSDYPDVAPPSHSYWVASFQIDDATPAQRILTAIFELPGPWKLKFLLTNRSGQAFPATGSTVRLYTFNRTIG